MMKRTHLRISSVEIYFNLLADESIIHVILPGYRCPYRCQRKHKTYFAKFAQKKQTKIISFIKFRKFNHQIFIIFYIKWICCLHKMYHFSFKWELQICYDKGKITGIKRVQLICVLQVTITESRTVSILSKETK